MTWMGRECACDARPVLGLGSSLPTHLPLEISQSPHLAMRPELVPSPL